MQRSNFTFHPTSVTAAKTSPLNDDEIKRYIDWELLSLLEIMSLTDTDGWELFGV